MAVLALMSAALVGGCTAEDDGLAARWNGGSLTEDEVTAYTQAFREEHVYTDDDTWAQFLYDAGMWSADWRTYAIGELVDEQLGNDDELAALVATDEQINDYIDTLLTSRVVRRYSSLVYDTQSDAQAALERLSAYSGDELQTAFADEAARDDDDQTTTENGGDIGWDISYSMDEVQQDLNDEMLQPGALSGAVHAMGGRYYVLLCTDRFVFEEGTTYASLPDASLADYVQASATLHYWGDITNEYYAQKRTEAQVQMRAMPADAPYNVDTLIQKLAAEGNAQ